MARSAHVATTTRKQVRPVPYAHPAKPNRSLGQGLSRHKPYHVESLPKPTLGLGHATLVFPNVYMHSAQDPTFDTGTNTATTGLNTPELVRYIPGQPTEYPGLIASLSWNSFHHPDISTGVIPEECLSPTWANSGVELPGSDHDHACAGWPFNQSQHHGQFFQQPLQSSGSFTREGTDSFADTHSEVVAAYVCQQSGALYPGPLGIPYYPIITADSTQVLPYNITLLQPSEARGAMDESWVFEPVETSFIASYGDRELAETLADNVPAYLAPSSDSEDGVLVERPRASDESSDGRPTSPSGLVTQPLAVAKRHSRSRLSPERRLQAASTRKWRACIRCYIQKIRCIPNPENPRGSCCLTCTNVSRESKKVIHRLPCLRLRLTEVVMFRGGGLNLTSRWTGTAVKDLSPNDWVDSELRTLTWQLEHSPRPLQFTVKRFRPLQGDCVTRKWRDTNGQPRETWIEPFGLADIQKTASDYMAYNFTFSLASLNMVKETMIGQVEDVVCRTYDEVSKLIVMTERPPGLRGKNVHPADFLHQYVKLWFGIRNSVGSAYITPGTDTLDMVSERHPDYPYGSRISIPRMISEQFYNLQYEKLLVPTRKRVLEDLNRMMTGKQPDHFFTVYLTVFMLLYETSFASADRHRRAMQYGEATYYSLPLFVEQLQFGANIVLLHWHYYKRGFNPLRTDWDNVKDKAIWSTLSVAQRQFLCDSWQYFEDRAARPMEKLTWKDDLYFVAQMFEDDLCFGATYSGS